MLPEDWKQQLDGYDAIYFGAVGEFISDQYIIDKLTSRRSNTSPRSHLPLGQSDSVPPRIRPIHLPSTVSTTPRYRMPPSQQEIRGYRFLGGPREYRGRILVHRRKNVPRYRPRVCRSRYHHDQNRSRPSFEIRFRARSEETQEEVD
jgi:hypothetical protein